MLFLLSATYLGHVKAWINGSSNKKMHFKMLIKNVSLIGAALLIIGYVIPQIGAKPREDPLGLGVRLGPVGWMISALYDRAGPSSQWCLKFCATLVFSTCFVIAGVHHAKNYATF